MALILDHTGKPMAPSRRKRPSRRITQIRAAYDAARNDSDALMNVWSNADHMSPDNSNRLSVRRWLRERSRYEFSENNPYVLGIIRMVVSDFVGRGPRLQITDERLSPEQRKNIESRYQQWSKAINYREKLKQMRTDKIITGEAFKRSYSNPRVRNRVKLDFQIIEADRITTQYLQPEIMDYKGIHLVDGIEFDAYENPYRYYLLHSHPGAYHYQGNPMSGDWINSIDVRHWFRKDRDYHRGIPELTASLPLGALWRRFKLATLLAAETAAEFAMVMETELPPWTEEEQYDQGTSNTVTDDDGNQYNAVTPMDKVSLEKNMMTTLPYGSKLNQVKSEHPSTEYRDFVDVLLMEIIRPLQVPFNYASGSSAGSNMSSASVDVDVYKRAQNDEHYSCEANVVEPDTFQWWQEGMLIDGYFEGDLGEFLDDLPEHEWLWDKVAQDHSDPLKVAQAKVVLREANIILDSDLQAEYGRSLETWQKKATEQQKYRRENQLDNSAAAIAEKQIEAARANNEGDDDEDKEDVENGDADANEEDVTALASVLANPLTPELTGHLEHSVM